MRITNLRLARQDQLVFEALNLRSEAHRLGLVGPNGAGKSSLLLTLQGLVSASEGSIKLEGRPGLLFQNPDHQLLFPTVLEELCFGAQQRGELGVEARAQELAQAHGASHLLGLATHELSEGQKQLVCLLAVLMDKPDVLLLDEPCAGLDHRLTAQLMHTLLGLPQRLIVATHRLELLHGFEEVIWLEDGLVQMQGPADVVVKAYAASGNPSSSPLVTTIGT
jgi:biotin transport system ATP-binding protein